MEGRGTGSEYTRPLVSDYGDLLELTADSALLMHVGLGASAINPASAPGPGGPGGRGGPDAPLGDVPQGDVLDEGPQGTNDEGLAAPGNGDGGEAAGAGTEGGGGGGKGGGDGGSLPFTGFGAALVGAIGAGMSAAGVAARKALRRR